MPKDCSQGEGHQGQGRGRLCRGQEQGQRHLASRLRPCLLLLLFCSIFDAWQRNEQVGYDRLINKTRIVLKTISLFCYCYHEWKAGSNHIHLFTNIKVDSVITKCMQCLVALINACPCSWFLHQSIQKNRLRYIVTIGTVGNGTVSIKGRWLPHYYKAIMGTRVKSQVSMISWSAWWIARI